MKKDKSDLGGFIRFVLEKILRPDSQGKKKEKEPAVEAVPVSEKAGAITLPEEKFAETVVELPVVRKPLEGKPESLFVPARKGFGKLEKKASPVFGEKTRLLASGKAKKRKGIFPKQYLKQIKSSVKRVEIASKKLAVLEKAHEKHHKLLPQEKKTKQAYVREIGDVLKKIGGLEHRLRKQDYVLPKSLESKLSSLKNFEQPPEFSIEEEIGLLKTLIVQSRKDFFTRRISEEEFQKIQSNYTNRLRELEEKKKIIDARKIASAQGIPEQAEKKEQSKSTEKPVEKTVVSVEEKPASKLESIMSKELEQSFLKTAQELEKAISQTNQMMQTAKVEYLKGNISKQEYDALCNDCRKKLSELREKKQKVEREHTETLPPAKAPGKLVHPRHFAEIESQVAGMLGKYNISMQEIEKDVEKLDKEKILLDFHKLIDVIDVFRETMEMEKQLKQSFGGRFLQQGYVQPGVAAAEKNPALEISPEAITAKKRQEKIVAIAKEIKKYEIVTLFDSVLRLVQEKGSVSKAVAEKELGTKIPNFEEIAETLERNGLTKTHYPPIGDVVIKSNGVSGNRKEQKEGIASIVEALKKKQAQSETA